MTDTSRLTPSRCRNDLVSADTPSAPLTLCTRHRVSRRGVGPPVLRPCLRVCGRSWVSGRESWFVSVRPSMCWSAHRRSQHPTWDPRIPGDSRGEMVGVKLGVKVPYPSTPNRSRCQDPQESSTTSTSSLHLGRTASIVGKLSQGTGRSLGWWSVESGRRSGPRSHHQRSRDSVRRGRVSFTEGSVFDPRTWSGT